MLQAHGGKFSCPYCEDEPTLDGSGPLRTYASIREWHRKFVEDGSKTSQASKYKNCVRPCLLLEDGETQVLDAIPPPQLHLHMAGVNSAMDVIMQLWGEEDTLAWCKRNHIIRRGYQGGTFDGNNSKRILEKLDDLSLECPTNCQPLIEVLETFKGVVEGVFGQDLAEDYEIRIVTYAEKFKTVQVNSKIRQLTLKTNIKVLEKKVCHLETPNS
jgi:hypothetical protein